MIKQRKSKLLHDSELLTYSILAYLEDIHQLRGPNFTQFFKPPPPSSGQLWTFFMIPTLCLVTKHGPPPPLFLST